MIVLDASVLIGHLNRQDAHNARAGRLLAGFDPAEGLGASVITIAEALTGPARASGQHLETARRAMNRLGVTEIGWWEGAALLLAGLRAATLLKMPDCCVLAVAQRFKARIATFDGQQANAAREQGITVADVS